MGHCRYSLKPYIQTTTLGHLTRSGFASSVRVCIYMYCVCPGLCACCVCVYCVCAVCAVCAPAVCLCVCCVCTVCAPAVNEGFVRGL